jgi:hypothetical protein
MDERVTELARLLKREVVDLVVTNIGFIPILAARAASITSIAFSSVNWHGLLAHYCGAMPGIKQIVDDIGHAYRAADAFLRLTPGMDMSGFGTIGVPEVIALRGQDRRGELHKRLGLTADTRIVAFSFLEPTPSPRRLMQGTDTQGMIFLCPPTWPNVGAWVRYNSIGLSFLDAVASADLVVAKPGYGIVTEAAVAGTPLLLLGRRDWPETTSLLAWLSCHGVCEHDNMGLDDLTINRVQLACNRLRTRRAAVAPETTAAAWVAKQIAARIFAICRD